MKTWKEMITASLESANESWEDVEACTLTIGELNRSFDDGWGSPEGSPFTLWTKNRVYFPICYDGAEWVESVPRQPCNEATSHLGGY